MRDLRKRPRAERDLREIWRDSFANWGVRKADAYLRRLDVAIRQLVVDPERGQDCAEVGPGLRRLSIERHRVFYKYDEMSVIVVRVLHDQMNFVQHLDADSDIDHSTQSSPISR